MKNVSLLFVSLLILFSSCGYVAGERVRGNGAVKTEDRAISAFSGVRSSGSFDVIVSSGNHAVRVEAEDNLLPYIETWLEGDVLKVRTKKGYRLRPKRDVKIHVTAPSFTEVRLDGSGNITSVHKITGQSELDLGIEGSGDIKIDVNAPTVKAEIAGSGNIILEGEAKNFEGVIRGSGDIRAMDFKTEQTKVDISGSGNANVFASVQLDVEVRGSGDVRYKGGANVKSDIKGSGSVNKAD